MNRAVLIVTPFFAPQNHSAVFRAYKLAKYLPQFGWKPTVLTVDTQYEYNEDASLIADLPTDVDVLSARYIEPTLRGLRMAMGGRDRTFKVLKVGAGAEGSARMPGPPSFAQRAYRAVLKDWVQVPDAHWTWARTATRLGKKIVRERGIPLVLTTAPPYSSLLVGSALQRAGAKWIADFRDPLAYTRRLSSDSARIYWQQRSIVKNTLKNANGVTMAASCFRSIYFDMFGQQGPDPVFIPTGMDAGLMGQDSRDDQQKRPPYLLFAGEYLSDYDTAFFEAFASALQHPGVQQTGLKLLMVGTLELNRTRLAPLIDRYRLYEHVEFLDQRPQREVYRLLQNALGGVLIPGSRAYWWTTFAKMTDCIGMRKPVVAVVPDPSEARTALTRSRLGVFLDGCPANRARILTEFLLGTHALTVPDEGECERYTAGHQVQSFVELFESITNR
jgi:glycosyltransferase involved in cell wall biosynthesis